MDFVAIDFETATEAADSACSVAVVVVDDGVLADSYYSLIRPPGNRYLYWNTRVHGLTAVDTEDAPTFAEIWGALSKYLEGNLVIAHNASFDMGVLMATLKTYNLAPVPFSYCCTVKLARRLWPKPLLPNHKLNTVADYLGITFRHHDALEDARACAEIPLAGARVTGVHDFVTLAQELRIPLQRFGE